VMGTMPSYLRNPAATPAGENGSGGCGTFSFCWFSMPTRTDTMELIYNEVAEHMSARQQKRTAEGTRIRDIDGMVKMKNLFWIPDPTQVVNRLVQNPLKTPPICQKRCFIGKTDKLFLALSNKSNVISKRCSGKPPKHTNVFFDNRDRFP